MDNYVGKILDDRYEILAPIGSGGMAVVYKARCRLLDRFVAVKILKDEVSADRELRERFENEAKAVAMLSHNNIVSIYDVSKSQEIDYIVMELIDGITLKEYMRSKDGPLNVKESVWFASQIAKALAHAHEKGIVHRDVKPQNVMITMNGVAKVADFGIAYLESVQSASVPLNVGSVNYLSPEQARGLPADARSDLYSLGIVLFEMLTGVLPYSGGSADEIALLHATAVPPAPSSVNPSVPSDLDTIVQKAMEPDIEKRYQSADELQKDLDSFLLSMTGSIATVNPDPAPAVSSEDIFPDVEPISRTGEMTKEKYRRRHRRSVRISLLSGIFIILAFCLLVFLVLWNYFLRDIFAEPERITIPNFIGSDYEDIVNGKEFQELYNFSVEYNVDPNTEAGVITAQEPVGGKSIMLDQDGIDIVLTVSTGVQMIRMPDVCRMNYKDAVETLQKEGFVVQVDYESSDSIGMDIVISSNPEPGDSIPAGARVYLIISSGKSIQQITMPNLIGLSRTNAIERIESSGLTLGTVTYVSSNMPVGCVIWQSIDANKEVEAKTTVYLQVSDGPKETPSPSPSPTPAPTPAPTPVPETPVTVTEPVPAETEVTDG